MKFPYRILAFTIAATAAAACLDQAAFDGLFVPKTADHPAGIYGYDWAMGLKQLGTLYPWLLAGVIVFLFEKDRDPPPRQSWRHAAQKAILVPLAPLLAGAVAVVDKLIVHRSRPPESGAIVPLWQVLEQRRDLLDPGSWTHARFFEAADSFPSGHATVAFAAAFVLARLYPCAAWVWYALAGACALTRVLDHAHHASDVVFAVGAAIVGVWMAVNAVDWVGLRLDMRHVGVK